MGSRDEDVLKAFCLMAGLLLQSVPVHAEDAVPVNVESRAEPSAIDAVAVQGTETEAARRSGEDAFWRANEAYSAGDYDEAVRHFQRAYEFTREPAVLYNIAQCYRQLHDCARARRAFAQYLETEKQPAEQVHGWLGELEQECTGPETVSPAESPSAGSPVVVGSERGRLPAAEQLALVAPRSRGMDPPQAEVSGRVDAPPAMSRALGWSLMGAGVVSTAAATWFYHQASESSLRIEHLSERLKGSDETWDAEGDGLDHQGRVQQGLFVGLGAAGLALLGTGVALLVLPSNEGDGANRTPTTKLGVAKRAAAVEGTTWRVAVTPHGGQAICKGEF